MSPKRYAVLHGSNGVAEQIELEDLLVGEQGASLSSTGTNTDHDDEHQSSQRRDVVVLGAQGGTRGQTRNNDSVLLGFSDSGDDDGDDFGP